MLSSQINYTCTNLAEHLEGLDHNSVYRYLKNEKLTLRLLREKARETLIQSAQAYLIFDDTVIDNSYSFEIAGVRRQYRGNADGLIKGIGVVTLVYFHAELDRYWIIDYCLFDPDRDGKTKLDHVAEMLSSVERRGLKFGTVLMDAWYATVPLITRIHKADKLFYCPIKKNRRVDETRGQEPYRGVESLTWRATQEQQGKLVKVKGFVQDTYLKLFRVVVSTGRTDYIVTNDVTQSDTDEAQKESGQRWKVEQFHRQEKQVTGIERGQCRLNRSQRNHLCASRLVWLCFKELADKTRQTVYQLKHNLLSDYLKQQFRNPTIAFC